MYLSFMFSDINSFLSYHAETHTETKTHTKTLTSTLIVLPFAKTQLLVQQQMCRYTVPWALFEESMSPTQIS